MKRLFALLITTVVLLTGCELEQLEIYPTLRGTGAISIDRFGIGEQITLSGYVHCNRWNYYGDAEHLDLFINIDGYGVWDGNSVCTPNSKLWVSTTSARYVPESGFLPITEGSTRKVEITFCTYPSQEIDEDCVTASRWVKFKDNR